MTSFNGFPGIGQLSIVGWLTIILYFWAVFRCWIIVRELGWAADSIEKAKELRGWRSMMAAFFALGVSKQFNLQAALSETGRAIARFQGWYGQRQSAQLAFVLVMALLSLIAAIVLVRWVRNAPVSTWLALAASTMLIGYWVIRATSFHAFDRLVDDVRIGGIRLDSFLEIGGIVAVLVASYWRQFEIRKLKHRSF
jgi:phosphate/sulfate permease